MKQKLKNILPKSEFARNVLTLMTGTTIAQAIPIAISPILTRIYTPEDFGVLALFISITYIIGSISNGRYELALMLPEEDEDAINIFILGMLIVFFLSLSLLILVIIFNHQLVMFFKNKQIGVWLYFVPLTVFFIGGFNMLSYYNNRKRQYKDIAKANVAKSLVMSVVQVFLGFLKLGVGGLIVGQIMSHFSANVKLLKNVIKDKAVLSSIDKVKIRKMAIRYKKFPTISLGATFSNSLSAQLNPIIISTIYSTSGLGFFSLTEKALSAPAAFIGKSIGQVFFEEASKKKEDKDKLSKVFNTTIKKLIIIGFPIFLLMFLIVKPIFIFVFGEGWEISGIYAQILIPLFFSRFITSPVTLLPIVLEKNKIDLFFQIGMLLLLIFVFLFCKEFEFSLTNYVYTYSFSFSVYYLTYLAYLKFIIMK